jgi:4-hydroxy-3-methylbut-2-enyl diphosphate reductase
MKPQIIRSPVLGYCMGVSRAVKMAEDLAARRDTPAGRPAYALYTYGPLIHNTTVLRKLEQKGVRILEDTALPGDPHGADLRHALVIIRAHGVSPRVEAGLREAGAVIKDATCPKVKANQLLAQRLRAKENGPPPPPPPSPRPVFLAGDRRHAEIQGILGYAPDCVCVSTEAEAVEAAGQQVALLKTAGKDAAAAAAGGKGRAVLIGQTTFPVDDYRKIAAVLRNYFRLAVKDTICPATACRQDALRKLCTAVDAIIIAGGKDSANTRALAGIARAMGVPAYLLENAAEVKRIEPALASCRRIGLAAGASTPLETIDELEAAVLRGRA